MNQLDERPCPTCGHGSLLPHCASAACEWRRCGRADCQTTVDFPNLRAITLTAGDSKNGPAWVRVNLYGDQTGETT